MTDGLQALPHLREETHGHSINKHGVEREKQRWRLSPDLGRADGIPRPNSCQQQNKIYPTSPCCSWHWECLEPRCKIPASLKSLSPIFYPYDLAVHGASSCNVLFCQTVTRKSYHCPAEVGSLGHRTPVPAPPPTRLPPPAAPPLGLTFVIFPNSLHLHL